MATQSYINDFGQTEPAFGDKKNYVDTHRAIYEQKSPGSHEGYQLSSSGRNAVDVGLPASTQGVLLAQSQSQPQVSNSMYNSNQPGSLAPQQSGASGAMYSGTQPNATVAGAQSAQANYNPTAMAGSQTDFGTDANQFMIQPFIQPFDFQGQKSENQNLVSGFQGAIQGQETMPQMQQRYDNRYMIDELREMQQTGREAYQGVLNQLRAIPETTKATTRESMVTAGQAGKINQAEYQKLAPVAQQLGQSVEQVGQMLTDAEKNMNTSMQMEIAQQKKELMPWEWGYNMQTIMQAREFTGWSQSHQMELERLRSNQNAGLTWTNAETQRAHDLTVLEKEYQNSLGLIEKEKEMNFDYWG